MSGENYILSELIDDLTDLDSRLIYADWLEEQGDPRGEFTRVQCELQMSRDTSRKRELKKRQDELLTIHSKAWSSPITRLGIRPDDVVFRFGAIDSITISGSEFVEKQHEIFEAAPLLRSISFLDIDSKLTDSPFLDRFIQIRLFNESPEKIGNHLSSMVLPNLLALNLSHVFLETGFKNITSIDKTHFPKLIALDLERCGLHNGSVDMLRKWEVANGLKWLNLAFNELDDQVVSTLLNASHWTDIKNLRLFGSGLSEDNIILLGERFGTALDLYRMYARFQR